MDGWVGVGSLDGWEWESGSIMIMSTINKMRKGKDKAGREGGGRKRRTMINTAMLALWS